MAFLIKFTHTMLLLSVMKELTSRSGIEHTKSTPYNSQGNPICERANQLVLNMLGTLSPTDKYRRYDHCEYVSYAYNTIMDYLLSLFSMADNLSL